MHCKSCAFVILLLCLSSSMGWAQDTPSADEEVTIIHNSDPIFLKIGEKRVVFCKGSAKEKSWLDPRGKAVRERSHELRVHVERQERTQDSRVVLVFADARAEDNGTWTCAAGGVKKTVDVYIVEEVTFEGMRAKEEPVEGSRLELVCRARGIPAPDLTWYRDGVPMSMNGNRLKESEIRLRVERVQRGDSGEYECKSIQKVGSVYLHVNDFTIAVQVQHAPVMEHDSIVDVFAIMNETKVLRCMATAFPKPTYRWTSDRVSAEDLQKNVQTAEDGTYSELTLEISSPQELMTYTCIATNTRGKNKTKFHVQMGNKPQPLDTVEFVSATNESLEFAVTCENCTTDDDVTYSAENLRVTHYRFELLNSSDEEVDWTKREDEILGVELQINDTQSTYTVEGLQPETTYHIRAASVNLAGFSEFTYIPPQTTEAFAPALFPQYPLLLFIVILTSMNLVI